MKIKSPLAAVILLFLLTFTGQPTSLNAKETLGVDLTHTSGFNETDLSKVKEALGLLERIFNSDLFETSVLNFEFDGKKQFANNNNLTNEQIYQTIMNGRETYTQVDDHVAQLDLNLYTPPFWKKWSVIGYGYPGQPEIFMNHYYFDSFSIQQIAGNIAHEWMHKLGFEHDYRATAQRPFSVPYAIGEMVIKFSS